MLEFIPGGILRLQSFEVDGGPSAAVFADSSASVGSDSGTKSNGSVHEVVV